MNTYEYNVCSAYVPYLINGDASDLEDWEIKKLEEFEGALVEEHGAGHWDYNVIQGEKFCYCDVADVRAGCVVMDWIVMEGKQ
jgi:hypothetical protein